MLLPGTDEPAKMIMKTAIAKILLQAKLLFMMCKILLPKSFHSHQENGVGKVTY